MGGKLILEIEAGEAEPLAEWIRESWQCEPVEVQEVGAPTTRLEIYFDSPPEAECALQSLPDGFLLRSAEAVSYRDEDWTTFWQHHFKVEEIGQHLRIVPEWEQPAPSARQDIIIQPGLSFGTGGHFTTRFCLEALEEALEDFSPMGMLDAGAGSGILSIAAAKLGVSQIEAFDYDPICVTQCVENAERNGVNERIHFFQADLLDPDFSCAPADLVCANILTSVLIQGAETLAGLTGRRLILSGIRAIEAEDVLAAFIPLGFRKIAGEAEEVWCGLVLERE